MNIRKGIDEGGWKKAMKQKQYLICAIYLILVAVAEFSMTLDHPKICIMTHAIILFLLLFHSVLEWDKDKFLSRFLMALLLVPLIRILSFSLPYVHFNLVSWFIIVSVPIFIAIITIMWLQRLRPKDVGLLTPFNLRRMPIAAGVILVAIPIGIMEYLILKPNPLPGLETTDFISAVLIFVICTGFLEELAFRGVLQYNAVRLFGKWIGIVIVSAFFGLLHAGNISPWNLDCVLAFSAGFLFSIVRERGGTIYGISIAHGLINIVLFLIAPLYL